MNRRELLTWASSISLLNILPQKDARACEGSPPSEVITISSRDLNQFEQTNFEKLVRKHFPQPFPYNFSRDKKFIQIRVPTEPEYIAATPCDVTVKVENTNSYCKKIYIFAEIIYFMEKMTSSRYKTQRQIWSYQIANFSFGEQCLPYCAFRFRAIEHRMSIGVVAELGYFDKAKAGPRFFATKSDALYVHNCGTSTGLRIE